MSSLRVMVVAGEASGDLLAAELVRGMRTALSAQAEVESGPQPTRFNGFEPQFFGAGGPHMAAAGVDLELDLTAHAVLGITDALRGLVKFSRIFTRLLRLAQARQPHLVVLVDNAGFNRRFAAAIKGIVRARSGPFHNWHPRIVYYVSPQVWASRPGRAHQLARDVDLLLSIFPFERSWYAQRVPQLHVEFVGHPMVDRYAQRPTLRRKRAKSAIPLLALLPGSRTQELRHHLPVMIETVRILQAKHPLRLRMILPRPELTTLARQYAQAVSGIEFRTGDLASTLAQAEVALVCSGTATLECALSRLPAVVLYRASWITFAIARRVVHVPHVAMPNLLARQTVYPEFLQEAATPDNLGRETLDLLTNAPRRDWVKRQLDEVVLSLGPPGAASRAAAAVLRLINSAEA